ncbi:hypothetical protein DFP72DRAFT_1043381 [Ephemerocybe angulata]|uniref:Uncharacterized protein n=1 Tax=Ephemerocybe angulata TaxID=980116 RepID=A0A8H6I7I7_9AGAR|nr:hypothetical protein DFP72DRAFT_1043381 [Tulosesus angulatus]
MRVSFINLLAALGALASLVNAYHDDYAFAARDYLDELTTSTRSLDRREILADIATRDLLYEVADRLEARSGDPYPQFKCLVCGATFAGTKGGQKSMSTFPCKPLLALSTAHACLDGERVPHSLRERCGGGSSLDSTAPYHNTPGRPSNFAPRPPHLNDPTSRERNSHASLFHTTVVGRAPDRAILALPSKQSLKSEDGWSLTIRSAWQRRLHQLLEQPANDPSNTATNTLPLSQRSIGSAIACGLGWRGLVRLHLSLVRVWTDGRFGQRSSGSSTPILGKFRVRRSQRALLAIGFFVDMMLTVFSTLLYFAERGMFIPAAAWFVAVSEYSPLSPTFILHTPSYPSHLALSLALGAALDLSFNTDPTADRSTSTWPLDVGYTTSGSSEPIAQRSPRARRVYRPLDIQPSARPSNLPRSTTVRTNHAEVGSCYSDTLSPTPSPRPRIATPGTTL